MSATRDDRTDSTTRAARTSAAQTHLARWEGALVAAVAMGVGLRLAPVVARQGRRLSQAVTPPPF